jgi:uncharacterized protein
LKAGSFTDRHPYLFVGLLEVLVIIVYLLAGAAATILSLPTVSLYLAANIVLAIVTAGILTATHRWREVGFRALSSPRVLPLFALPFVPVLFNLAFGVQTQSVNDVLIFLLLAASVGFVEEAIFRGLMLRAIAPRGIWRAAAITAVLFGVSHSLNALAGSSVAYTLLQVAYALAIGFAFAAVALRARAIWPLVIIHCLIDFAGYIAADRLGATEVESAVMIISVAYVVVFTAYGLFLLRNTSPSLKKAAAAPV